MWLLLAFIIVPMVEIGLFIQVGGWLGLWPTLAIVLLTAILGTWLVRAQGALALSELRGSLSGQSDPTEALANGAMILVAGVLLLTPGFFTDAVGFALLTPPFRKAAFVYLRKRVKVQTFSSAGPNGRRGPRPTNGANTIEGEYVELDPDDAPQHDPPRSGRRPSGWTRD
ncbi:FxsA family protein [Roseovarius nanhaiticus]|uniref:FxsA family protein n=1 Tax=Roseovarius nanhaiticus TaxID=573024 RepID=UPI002491AC2A|nr:FxsA family protein [Roseovarius nanhaiticus]